MRLLILALLVPFTVQADLVEIIRDNDPGLMTMVQPEDVQVIKSLDFTGPSQWFTEKDGFHFNSMLAGMETACIENNRNPCQFDDTPGCNAPIGRLFDEPAPTAPLTVIAFDPASTNGIMHYISRRSPTGVASVSRDGCGPIDTSQGCDWGDCPWSIIFDQPYTAFCFDVRFDGRHFDDLRHQHLNFWNENGNMLGHRDLFGEAVNQDNTYCWVSDEPVAAMTSWQGDPGPGNIWWIRVHVGQPATTACERAERASGEAADAAAQICLAQ